eukprot:TRINITY_DN9853_c0_g2_i3.p1 TRINITY_DN9853_c0_g2~~TRINITY_DN9853_c0_g2_i3.p1  ORF type:complete len:1384 (+),score=377.24 TRINITY_DN9853_c0_g2_i3:241-4152(+)
MAANQQNALRGAAQPGPARLGEVTLLSENMLGGVEARSSTSNAGWVTVEKLERRSRSRSYSRDRRRRQRSSSKDGRDPSREKRNNRRRSPSPQPPPPPSSSFPPPPPSGSPPPGPPEAPPPPDSAPPPPPPEDPPLPPFQTPPAPAEPAPPAPAPAAAAPAPAPAPTPVQPAKPVAWAPDEIPAWARPQAVQPVQQPTVEPPNQKGKKSKKKGAQDGFFVEAPPPLASNNNLFSGWMQQMQSAAAQAQQVQQQDAARKFQEEEKARVEKERVERAQREAEESQKKLDEARQKAEEAKKRAEDAEKELERLAQKEKEDEEMRRADAARMQDLQQKLLQKELLSALPTEQASSSNSSVGAPVAEPAAPVKMSMLQQAEEAAKQLDLGDLERSRSRSKDRKRSRSRSKKKKKKRSGSSSSSKSRRRKSRSKSRRRRSKSRSSSRGRRKREDSRDRNRRGRDRDRRDRDRRSRDRGRDRSRDRDRDRDRRDRDRRSRDRRDRSRRRSGERDPRRDRDRETRKSGGLKVEFKAQPETVTMPRDSGYDQQNASSGRPADFEQAPQPQAPGGDDNAGTQAKLKELLASGKLTEGQRKRAELLLANTQMAASTAAQSLAAAESKAGGAAPPQFQQMQANYMGQQQHRHEQHWDQWDDNVPSFPSSQRPNFADSREPPKATGPNAANWDQWEDNVPSFPSSQRSTNFPERAGPPKAFALGARGPQGVWGAPPPPAQGKGSGSVDLPGMGSMGKAYPPPGLSQPLRPSGPSVVPPKMAPPSVPPRSNDNRGSDDWDSWDSWGSSGPAASAQTVAPTRAPFNGYVQQQEEASLRSFGGGGGPEGPGFRPSLGPKPPSGPPPPSVLSAKAGKTYLLPKAKDAGPKPPAGPPPSQIVQSQGEAEQNWWDDSSWMRDYGEEFDDGWNQNQWDEWGDEWDPADSGYDHFGPPVPSDDVAGAVSLGPAQLQQQLAEKVRLEKEKHRQQKQVGKGSGKGQDWTDDWGNDEGQWQWVPDPDPMEDSGKGKGKGKKSRDKGKGKGKDKGKGKGKRRDQDQDGDEGGWKRKQRKSEDLPEKFGDTWEEPRQQTGLKLIGELAPPGTRWRYLLMDESRRSFAAYMPSPFNDMQCADFFEKVKDGTNWKQPEGTHGLVPRKTAWMAKKGCNCTYKYGGLSVEPQEFPPFMDELLRMCMHYCGINQQDWPDSCNLNLYEDGGMSVGWHSDDEVLFQGKFYDIRIISLSFGQTRKFELRVNHPEEGEKALKKISLSSGDLMTMEGMTQKHYQHRVPKEQCEGPRINLTWRWVLKHSPKCPAGRCRRY